LAHLDALPPCAEGSRIHHCLSSLGFYQHRWEAATEHAQISLEIAQQVGDKRGMADAYRALGSVASERGETVLGQECHVRSLELYRELGDLMRIASACNNLGTGHRMLGEMDRALALFQEGIQITRRIGDTRDEAMLLTTTAELYLDQGRWSLAIEHLERAQLLASESGTVGRLIEARWLLGAANERAGHLEEARRYLEKAESKSRETAHWRFAPRIYLDLARLCAMEGKSAQAQHHIKEAEEAAGPAPADLFLGHLHGCRGTLHACLQEWEAAIEQLEKSLEYMERAGLTVQVAQARLDLGTAYANRGQAGDRGRAREHLRVALVTFRRIEARRFAAMARAQLSRLGSA
jgi:tetratricopeptide (TPR) repeat protein